MVLTPHRLGVELPLTLGMPDFSVYTIVQKTQAQNNITERNVKIHDDVQCVTTFSLIQNPQTKESSINAKKKKKNHICPT